MIKRKVIYNILLTISILGIVIAPYGIINTMVSLKYETENVKDCISNVSGQNLCKVIRDLKIIFAFCILLLVCLIYFRKKIIQPKLNNIL